MRVCRLMHSTVTFLYMVCISLPVFASITGTVKNTTGNPVPGAFVMFIEESDPNNFFFDYTDDSGRYKVLLPVTFVAEQTPVPFTLHQNFPNPFNPSTTIQFSLTSSGRVNLVIYNITGQTVRMLVNDTMSEGIHTVVWDGRDDWGNGMASGLYLYRLTFGDRSETRKMLLTDGGGIAGHPGVASPVSHHGISLGKTAKRTESTTYRVTITGEDIVPYVESGIPLIDGETYDFVVIGRIFIKCLTMTVNQSGWGTTNPSVGSHSYDEGTVVTVAATPASGYRFVGWTGSVTDSTSATTTVTMSGDRTVTANFEKIPQPVICTISFPLDNSTVSNNIEIELFAVTSEPVKKVEFYFDGSFIASTIAEPYKTKWTPINVCGGIHRLTCIAISQDGKESQNVINLNVELRLGDDFKGGKIFFIDETGQHGLIASESDIVRDYRNSFFWGPLELIGASNKQDGVENTNKMAVASTNGSYAGYAFKNGLELNGYNDWYIPAEEELITLKQNKNYVGGFPTNSSEAKYWSSTELSIDTAFALNLIALMGTNVPKSPYSYKIRPIRKF